MNKRLLAFSLLSSLAHSKICDFSEVQKQIQDTGSFVALECDNPEILVNDRITITKNKAIIDGRLKDGRNILFKWDAGNIPAQYLTRSYGSSKEQNYYLQTHNTCSGSIYNPWYLFNVLADNVVLQNFQIQNVPDGIHVHKGIGTTFRKIEFKSVCEDALTIRSYKDPSYVDKTLIDSVVFWGGEDKVINNESGRVWIRNSSFYDSNRAIDTGNDDLYVSKNRGMVLLQNNYFKNVKRPMRGSDKGIIYSLNNVFDGKSISVYSGRTLGSIEAKGDRVWGTCNNMGSFSNNPRTEANPGDTRARNIPEYHGPANIKIDLGVYKNLLIKCKYATDPKFDAVYGRVAILSTPMPQNIENNFFEVVPANSD